MLLLNSHLMMKKKKCSLEQKSNRTSTLQRRKHPDPDAVEVRESMTPKWLVYRSLHILNKLRYELLHLRIYCLVFIQDCWPSATRIWIDYMEKLISSWIHKSFVKLLWLANICAFESDFHPFFTFLLLFFLIFLGGAIHPFTWKMKGKYQLSIQIYFMFIHIILNSIINSILFFRMQILLLAYYIDCNRSPRIPFTITKFSNTTWHELQKPS
jgi:hypothetical protein